MIYHRLAGNCNLGACSWRSTRRPCRTGASSGASMWHGASPAVTRRSIHIWAHSSLIYFIFETQIKIIWSISRLCQMYPAWHIAENDTIHSPTSVSYDTYLRLVPPSAHSYSSPPGRVWTKSERWDSFRTRHNSVSVCCWNGSRLNRSGPQKRTGSWIRIWFKMVSIVPDRKLLGAFYDTIQKQTRSNQTVFESSIT